MGFHFRSSLLCLLFLTLIQSILSDPANCIGQDFCETCLGADFTCGWCTDENYPSKNPRCMPKNDLLGMSCGAGKIEVNAEKVIVLEDKELQDYQQNGGETVQIRPQRVKLHLVKGHTTELHMTYRSARNNPLDLYYLMDLTYSMEDDRKKLVSVGSQLAQTLGTLTDYYRLGFGSFSDKPSMPMIMPATEHNPCKPAGETCEPAYDFRHHMSLTNDMKTFMHKVNESRVTGNLDNLEGTLDALMQVIVCTDKIGWREDARKIVIVATDGLMHFAGDGLLAGLVVPNDKKCYLDESGEYEAALKFDYPSLEEIYRELLKRKINVIFAVTEKVAFTYRQVVELMREVSSVEILRDDSSNIVDLVAEGYKKFVKKVTFVDTSPPNIDVSYKTDCGKPGGKMVPGHTCGNLDIGQEVNFKIGFTPNDFPADGVYNQVIRIEETGLSEYLEVEVEIQKPCPCQRSNETRPIRRDLCSNHGNFECGMCYCDEGWSGKICNCITNTGNTNDLLNQCRKPSESPTPSPICSNNGECECGRCFCVPGFEGKYCECPTCSESCSPLTADCICGICQCKPGWTGSRCACPISTDTCRSPDDEICSGQGNCVCGKCDCNPMFYGSFCEINQIDQTAEKTNKICQYFNPCVDKLLRERRNEKVDISEVCMDSNKMMFVYSFVDELEAKDEICVARVQFQDGLECQFRFIYDTSNNGKQLKIHWVDCEPENYAAWISFGVLGTLLLGLMCICVVKVWIYIQEKREFAHFVKQTQSAHWETTTSPLYMSPIREARMPDNMDGTEFN